MTTCDDEAPNASQSSDGSTATHSKSPDKELHDEIDIR